MASARIETYKADNLTLYAVLRNDAGMPLIAATPAWDTSFTMAAWGTYAVAMAEQVDGANKTGYYSVSQPMTNTAGLVTYEVRQQAGGSPAMTDARVEIGSFDWYGNFGDNPHHALMSIGFGTATRSGDQMTYNDVWTGVPLFALTMDPSVKGVRTTVTLI